MKKNDEFRKLYKPCDSCTSRPVLRYYYNNRDKILDKKKTYYKHNKEYLKEYNEKRKSKLSNLEHQIETLTEMIKTTVSVFLLYFFYMNA